MPSDPQGGPPRGWPPGFGTGEDERRAILALSGLRSLRPLSLHAEAWERGTATGCLESVRSGRLGSDGDREWLLRIDPDATAARVAAVGARFVTPADPEYDHRLLDLSDPPVGLFLRGRSITDVPDRVAIVGSRRCSDVGRSVAEDLGRALVSAGLAVVSGAAHGIEPPPIGARSRPEAAPSRSWARASTSPIPRAAESSSARSPGAARS